MKGEKQLCRRGLRKCWKCKNTLTLNSINFKESKSKGWFGFDKLCKPCRTKYTNSRNKRDRYKPKTKFVAYKCGAKQRNVQFSLTFDQFMTMWQQPCFYCGEQIDNIGIDRKYNNEGYTVPNSVPCCKTCNYMKKAMSIDDFTRRCKRIADRL